ncbi:uncharacterized protein LOC115501398 isoform X1 [Lynx canadensis]|uniref:uncharacterized protein LOC115501398 isoform X1 n=1 Tax=Lynx canadensis TaxID=61383 RepID=UPI0011B0641B|nr:uncharacterized protein LOC115501398 isoform X1 [Lynx canadensis]
MREPWTPGAMSTDGSSLCLQVPFTEVSRVLHSKPHLSFVSPGFPVSLDSRAQLCRFVTVCIFTCTGQHASAHLGQPDGYCWVPNGPRTTRRPPPVSKDATEKDTVVSLLHAHRARKQSTFIEFRGGCQPVTVGGRCLGPGEDRLGGAVPLLAEGPRAEPPLSPPLRWPWGIMRRSISQAWSPRRCWSSSRRNWAQCGAQGGT